MNLDFTALIASLGFWALLPIIGTIIVHLAFSAAVFNDAWLLKDERGCTVFVGPFVWSLSVLVGGVFVALAYWLIHHSAMHK